MNLKFTMVSLHMLVIVVVIAFAFPVRSASFENMFDEAQSAYSNAVISRNPDDFKNSIDLMEQAIANNKSAKDMYYANSTLGRAYMGYALARYPSFGDRIYSVVDVKSYIEYLQKAKIHIGKAIDLLTTSKFIDGKYGLDVDTQEIDLMRTIEARIVSRIREAGNPR